MGFFGLLGVVFIVLKLIGIITWSWWLVLLPIYGGVALLIGFLAISYIITIVITLVITLIKEKKGE